MTLDENSNLRQLVNLVDDLRDVGLHKYINLPRICVAGTQSSGKSSVLESIVGIDFLPRGDGIVTRRPIEFRLNRLKGSDTDDLRPYIVFEGNEERFYDFEKARENIQTLTNERAGTNKGVVDDPIVLSVYSPDCPDLSLIDLPGVTRVPLKNSDQTDDIEALTKDMIMRYASDPRTIILAVVAANVDMSTSDALQLARRADPLGVRTLGVITKIDLMDKGANAVSMLQNDEVPLRLGYTGVKNRSQKDVLDGVTIKQALENERKFFSEHKDYCTLNPSLWGIDSLVQKLTNVLLRHISGVLPELRVEVVSKQNSVRERLAILGEKAPSDARERLELLWQLIGEFVDVFGGAIRGRFVRRLHEFLDADAVSSVQIRSIFNDLLDNFVGVDPFDKVSDYDIDQAIRIHEGDSLPGFPSPDTFEYLMLPQLQSIVPSIQDCLVDKVYGTLELLSFKVAEKVFGRFPALCNRVQTLSQQLFSEEKEKTKAFLDQYVESETMYIFTNDSKYLLERPEQPEYLDRAAQVTQSTMHAVSTTIDNFKGKKTRYSPEFIQEFRRRLNVYFGIVLRNVRDSVPKMIGQFLVRRSQKNLHYKIYTSLSQQEDLDLLFGEPDHVARERFSLRDQMTVLSKAISLLNKDYTKCGDFDYQLNRDILTSQFNSLNSFSTGAGQGGMGVASASSAALDYVAVKVGASAATSASMGAHAGVSSGSGDKFTNMNSISTAPSIQHSSSSAAHSAASPGYGAKSKPRGNLGSLGTNYVNGFSNLNISAKKPTELLKKVVSNNPLFD
ncbi:dynamin [Theileria orientalis strain Shintoku]|uniref:Dynamin n=1 Tax=Theileria orientalis strain Shintoku TaxID=869250 RepID=J4DAX1_THEOR|nr:dynamin [Theileria orientalis strain Shintoku]BAM42235.1 dynamin [Theileria orientalis strain Shintoku]|eukprot:XP_009692536.1 dynamin [Theileria orientalis strain Shintoku]